MTHPINDPRSQPDPKKISISIPAIIGIIAIIIIAIIGIIEIIPA